MIAHLYAFCQKHVGLPGDAKDESPDRFTAEELRVTETGQVSTALKSETVFSLNARHAEALARKLDERRKDLPRHLASVKIDAARFAGYSAVVSTAAPAQSIVFLDGRGSKCTTGSRQSATCPL